MTILRDKQGRLLPTGECWCGCGTSIPQGNFFHPGHDKTAESAVVRVRYGSVVEFLVDHHYGPGGRNPKRELDEWNKKGWSKKGENN